MATQQENPSVDPVPAQFRRPTGTPRPSKIPKEFRDGSSPWCVVAKELMAQTYDPLERPLNMKNRRDNEKLNEALEVLLANQTLPHQDKAAAIAYLLSQYCEFPS